MIVARLSPASRLWVDEAASFPATGPPLMLYGMLAAVLGFSFYLFTVLWAAIKPLAKQMFIRACVA